MHSLIQTIHVLADQSPDEAGTAAVFGMFGALFAFACGTMVLLFLVEVFIAFMAYKLLSAVPAPYRKQEPKMAFLLLIPLFAFVWNFFVWPRISASYAEYFKAQGRTDVGDAGGSLALGYCICMVAAAIPYLGWGCLSLVSLILLIIYLSKMFGLKGQIKG